MRLISLNVKLSDVSYKFCTLESYELMNFKKKAFLAITIFYIVYLFVPLLGNYTPINSTSASIITAGSLFLMYSGLIKNKIFVWYASYLSILAFFVFIGHTITIGLGDMSEFRKLLIETGFTLPTIMIFLVLRKYNELKLYRIIAYTALAANILSFLYCIPLIAINPNILRAYISIGIDDLSRIGIPTYQALHSYVIFIPALIYCIRVSRGKIKYLFIGCFLLYLYIIYNASITTNLVITLMILLFSLLYKENIQKAVIKTSIFCLFVLGLHLGGAIEKLFDVAIVFTEGTYSNAKIQGFKDMYIGKSDDVVEGRSNLHTISIMSFIQSPIWGMNEVRKDVMDADFITEDNSVVGGHSSLLDRFGGMGLLGGIPFVMIFWLIYKDWKNRMPRGDSHYFYMFGVIAAFILLYGKGVFGQEGWFSLCIYLPCMILAVSRTSSSFSLRRQK